MADSGESDSAAELISTLSSMLPGALEYPEPPELTKEEVDLRKSNLPLRDLDPARGYSDDFLANLFTPSELLAFRFSIDARLSAKELQKLIEMLRHPAFDAKDIDHNIYRKFQNLIKVMFINIVFVKIIIINVLLITY
jgi:hypothetical protein